MKEYRFSIRLSADEFLLHYQGVNQVVVTTWGGTRVQFDAAKLRPYVTHAGVQGNFALVVDDQNRFVRLDKIG